MGMTVDHKQFHWHTVMEMGFFSRSVCHTVIPAFLISNLHAIPNKWCASSLMSIALLQYNESLAFC